MILTVSDENGKRIVEVHKKVVHDKWLDTSRLPEFEPEDIDAAGLIIHKIFIAGESYKGGLVVVIHAFLNMDDGSTDELISMTMCDTYGSISGYKHIVNGEKVRMRKAVGLDCLTERYGAIRIAMLKKAMSTYRKENKKNNGNELYADILVESRHLAHLYQEIEIAKDNIKIKVGVVNESKTQQAKLL